MRYNPHKHTKRFKHLQRWQVDNEARSMTVIICMGNFMLKLDCKMLYTKWRMSNF